MAQSSMSSNMFQQSKMINRHVQRPRGPPRSRTLETVATPRVGRARDAPGGESQTSICDYSAPPVATPA